MQLMKVVISASILLALGSANAGSARTFETVHSTLLMKSMANACLGLTIQPDGLPCNPAMTPLAPKKSFRAQVLASDGYRTVRDLKTVVDGEVSQEMVDTFFSREKVLSVEASSDLMYRSPEMNVQLTPIAIRGFSEVHNESNPDIDLYAVEEKGLRFQAGTQWDEEFLFGFQIRVLNRKVIRRSFNIFELGTEAGREILQPADQGVLFLEPGATVLLGGDWNARVSGMITNFGVISRPYPNIPVSVEPQVGFAISPPVEEGNLDFTLDYKSLSFQEKGADKLHLGVLYRHNEFYYSAGIDAHGSSAGINYENRFLNAGLMFATTRTLKERDALDNNNIYLQVGLGF